MPRIILATAVFTLVYLWLIVSRGHRAKAIWTGVGAMFVLPLLLGWEPILTPADLFVRTESGGWASINWNVMGIFAGTLIVAEAFIFSRVPAWCADVLIEKSPNVGWAILGVCIFSSAISAVAENVATVLIVAPIAIALARKLEVSAAPFLIGIAISSNLQGTATLIGDPPSMILAAHHQLNFNDFFWYQGRPGIFFAVQAGGVASFAVLWLMFRRYRQPVVEMEREEPRSWFPVAVMGVMILLLACASWVDVNFLWFGGLVCMLAGVVAWTWLHGRAPQDAIKVLKSYDWSTTFFLAGVFMMVYSLDTVGAIERAAEAVVRVTGSSVAGAFLLVVGFSVVISAFVDNVPYLAAMLPLISSVTQRMDMGGSMLLPFALLIGACLGGNITPIGASANVVAYGLLQKSEHDATFLDFVKIGLPFTVAAVGASGLFLWIVWA